MSTEHEAFSWPLFDVTPPVEIPAGYKMNWVRVDPSQRRMCSEWVTPHGNIYVANVVDKPALLRSVLLWDSVVKELLHASARKSEA